MKRLELISILLGLGMITAFSQDSIVTIPDPAFLNALIDLEVDTNNDSLISYEEAKAIDMLDVGSRYAYSSVSEISDMTGIEAFIILRSLNCSGNQLTSLDVSNNTALEELNCGRNQLTSLDVSNNTALSRLSCSRNQLTSLDVSKNVALKHLDCLENSITSLDLSNCSLLEYLRCYGNLLTSLDLSMNTALIDLICLQNQLTSLIVSNNAVLETLWCHENQLTSLDVSECVALQKLNCSENQLTSLDVSSNIALTNLKCGGNQLTSMDVSNCTVLGSFSCGDNQLTDLDVSNNLALYTISCAGNQLTTLDVSINTGLSYLRCDQNQLTSLDVSKNTALEYLRCKEIQLTSLDVSNNIALTDLDCGGNQLTSLDISNNVELQVLQCGGNQLTSLDLSNNTNLRRLYCESNQLTSLDVLNNIELGRLNCAENQLTSLNVSGCSDLWDLDCSGNQLASLDFSGCRIAWLHCDSNQLTSLDFSNNRTLERLYCEGNQLTSLNVYGCSDLWDLYCSVNHLASLDISTNTALDTLDISDMITLYEVFVWESFPADVTFDTTGSPNVFFTIADDLIKNIRFGSTGDPLNGLTIGWNSGGSADRIKWGNTPYFEKGEFTGIKSTSITGTQFDYTFPTQIAGSTIHYSIFDSKNGNWTDFRTYKTASDASDGQFTFSVVGDSRSYPDKWKSIADATIDTDFTLFLGDIISNGAEASQWDTWFEYGDKFISRELVYHTVGNHDDDDSPGGFDNFMSLYTLPNNELYYSFTNGNAVFICLNSEDPGNTDQNNWLLSTLEANKDQTWKIVFFHKPFFTSPSHEEDMWDYFNTWWKAFDDYGVDMIFNGHTHNYQRTKPINRNVSTNSPVENYGSGEGEGRCQIVAGSAGPLDGPADPYWWLDNSASKRHFCTIDIDGGVLSFKVLDANRIVFDEFVINKTTGISDFTSTNNWIYPNPTNDIVTLQLRDPGEHSIEILSLNGQLLFSKFLEGSSHQIDLSSFQKGVYLITIRSNDFVTTRKIIKL